MNSFKQKWFLSLFSSKAAVSPFYSVLSESNENLSHHEELAIRTQLCDRLYRSLWRWKMTVASLCLINTVTLLFIGVQLFIGPSDKQCTRQLSIYSPAVEGIEYEEITLQNSFNEPSIYRGPPTPAIEDAWHQLYRFGLMAIPDSKMYIFSNSTMKSQYERVPPEMGDGYRAMPDVLHQLHCLNTIRQYTWFPAGHYGPESPHKLPVPHALQSGAVGNRMHADHCIETIRKVLMCHADVTPLLDIVDPQNPLGRKGDFNVRMKCRNFGRLQDWLRQNMKIPFAELTDNTA